MDHFLNGHLLPLVYHRVLFWDRCCSYCTLMLAEVPQHASIRMFADDVLLYAPANILKGCSSLQDDLTAISSWAGRWQLKLNPTKCEALMITNKRKPIPFTYFIDNQPISWSNPVKYLGVQITNMLHFQALQNLLKLECTISAYLYSNGYLL